MKMISNTRHRWKKTLLLVGGGSTELGQVITEKFAHTRFRKWKVYNLDWQENPKATRNFIINPNETIKPDTLEKLDKDFKEFGDEIDALINLSDFDSDPDLKISSPYVFDEYEKMRNYQTIPLMLSVHMASNFLAPTGYVAIGCKQEAFRGQGLKIDDSGSKVDVKTNFLEQANSKALLQTVINLADSRAFKDDLIYQNATVNALMLGLMNTQANRKKYPTANFMEWLPLNGVATLLKMWCGGESRPDNGVFVSFKTQGKKGKVVFPDYH